MNISHKDGKINQVLQHIQIYLQLSSIICSGTLEGESKKNIESRRLVQIFYLGFIDGMCQLIGLSDTEQAAVEIGIIQGNNNIKELKISDKEFPLKDWYQFNNSSLDGIADKIEGRVLYYGGLTARVHAGIIQGYLNRDEHGTPNAMNAMEVAIHYNNLTKAKFRAKIDEEIEALLLLDREVTSKSKTNKPIERASNSGCIIPIMISLSSFGLLIWILIL